MRYWQQSDSWRQKVGWRLLGVREEDKHFMEAV
jgi:hypothetical protein